MSHNWFQGQTGQYGQQQQPWGNHQQQGWVQGGQWVGQPHPQQQTGSYGNQQQSDQMGYQRGPAPQFQQQFQAQQFGQQPQQFGQQQPQFGPQTFPQSQFNMQQFGAHVPQPEQQPTASLPQQQANPQEQQGVGRGGHFLSQQDYAKEHERRVKEEKKKKELEEQKKKLQSLKVTKQTVNIDDLFQKQLPSVSRDSPSLSTPPPVSQNSTSDSEPSGSDGGQCTTVVSDGGNSAGTDESVATAKTQPNTAETIQRLMSESLDITSSTKSKKKQFNKSSFKQQTTSRKETVKQSVKARSWGTDSNDDFSGVFAQHWQQEQSPQEPQEGGEDDFGTFQSSGHMQAGSDGVPASLVANQFPDGGTIQSQLVGNAMTGAGQSISSVMQGGDHMTYGSDHMMESGGHMMPVGNHVMQGGGHMMQPGSQVMYGGTHMMQAGSNVMQGDGHMMQTGGHMIQVGSQTIATSAYQGPLSSPNVLPGTQGQPPNSPQRVPATTASSSHSHSLPAAHQTSVQNLAHMTTNQSQQQLPNSVTTTGLSERGNVSPPVSTLEPHTSGATRSPSPSGANVETSRFHPLYHKVYRLCRNPGEKHVSTELLYPVLLSSKLSKAQLRDLWSRANKGQPGKLSQIELFVLLGLVALAQAGKENPSLEDLKRTSSMPVPTLPALSTLSPPPSDTEHPSFPYTNQTAEDEFGHFHSSMAPPPSHPPLQATPTLQPQPVSIPFHPPTLHASGAPVNPANPDFPAQLQSGPPVTQHPLTSTTTSLTGYSYATFSEVQSVISGNTDAAQVAGHSSLLPGSSNDEYGAFKSAGISGSVTPRSDSTGAASPVPSQLGNKYSAFDTLRPQSSSPHSADVSLPLTQPPANTVTARTGEPSQQPRGGVTSQLSPQQTSQPPLALQSLLQPLASGSPTLNPSITGPPSPLLTTNRYTANSSSSKPPSGYSLQQLSAPSPLPQEGPLSDKNGTKGVKSQPQEDNEFGEFAQFSTSSTDRQPKVGGNMTTGAFDGPLLSARMGDGSIVQKTVEEEGWADFEQFSSVPVQHTSNQVALSGAQNSSVINEQGSPTSHGSGKQASTDLPPANPWGFDFHHGGSKEDQSSVPTIDGMEKDLLSKLTPTLPRKAKDGISKSEDNNKRDRVERPVSHPNKPVMGEEEVWRVCLVKCGEVLGACVEVLRGAEEEVLLQEIAGSKEAQSKLHGIAEVYRFSKRICATMNAKTTTDRSASVAEEVKNSWKELNSLLTDNTMEKIYTSTQPHATNTEVVADDLLDTISSCAICLMSTNVTISSSLSLDGWAEEYSMDLLLYNGQRYHAPCANFWRHFVSEDLPTLG